jgi:hypothetical protein
MLPTPCHALLASLEFAGGSKADGRGDARLSALTSKRYNTPKTVGAEERAE